VPDRRRDLLLLFGLALAVRLLTALPIHQPGYTDACYYATGARQIYEGQGFVEPFIWNYLDPPDAIPHPGYQYWMPLPALLGGLGMWLLGDAFFAMQLPFILLSALLPLVAYTVAWDLTSQRKHALLAGLLAVFPGFFGLGRMEEELSQLLGRKADLNTPMSLSRYFREQVLAEAEPQYGEA